LHFLPHKRQYFCGIPVHFFALLLFLLLPEKRQKFTRDLNGLDAAMAHFSAFSPIIPPFWHQTCDN
jgi:hypothetical protein